jgi:hypothetical protein
LSFLTEVLGITGIYTPSTGLLAVAKRRQPTRKIVSLREIVAALRLAMKPRSDLSTATLRLNSQDLDYSRHIFWRALNLKDRGRRELGE